MTDQRIFDLGPTTLACGITLPTAHLSYQIYGELNVQKSNLILYPTSYGAYHTDLEWTIGSDSVLDPTKYCIVIPNQLGNGLSTSPSNLPEPFTHGNTPQFSHLDNIAAQDRLLREVLGVEEIALIYGWSMGGQQALHWGALFPERVHRICAVCTSARTSPHNALFLEGLRAALTADAAWNGQYFTARPIRGLQAFARIYAGWAISQAFYREECWREFGFATREDFIIRGWIGRFQPHDPMDLLSMVQTWIDSDISNNDIYKSDLSAALGAITADTMVMPGSHDLYFTVEDSKIETSQMPNAELRTIQSIHGHRAGNPNQMPEEAAFIRQTVAHLMGR